MDPATLAVAVKPATEWYVSQGVLGVTCLGLIIVVIFLWRKNEELHRQNDSIRQEQLKDAKEYASFSREAIKSWTEFKEKLMDEVEKAAERRAVRGRA